MSTNEKFLTQRQRYQPVMLPQDFSDEEMARDWTLTTSDLLEIERYRARFRLFISLQVCAVRLYGRFIQDIGSVSPRIVSYLNNQLSLPPSLTVASPEREATLAEQRKNILTYLGFTRYDENIQSNLKLWLVKQAEKGFLPDALFLRAEQYLLSSRVILPGPTIAVAGAIGLHIHFPEQQGCFGQPAINGGYAHDAIPSIKNIIFSLEEND